jgi:hypothetical protein
MGGASRPIKIMVIDTDLRDTLELIVERILQDICFEEFDDAIKGLQYLSRALMLNVPELEDF